MNLELLYFRVTSVWQLLCEKHSLLYDYTCDEYQALLKSDLEELSAVVEEKEVVITAIKKLENERVKIIDELNQISDFEVKDVKDLITFFHDFEGEKNENYLNRFNKLLIEIIEMIQEQNNLNQKFLNKAIHSLRTLKESLKGKKNFDTYNSSGESQALRTK